MTLRNGSAGASVEAVQTRLRQLGLYSGPIDGKFGGGTEAAVRNYQKQFSLNVDGEVGPQTWASLFPDVPAPESPLTDATLTQRCLALTGTFETSTPPPECFAGLTGDFDGQGISFGVLQWNFGQDSLQPLLKTMITANRTVCEGIFHDNLQILEDVLGKSKAEQLEWTRSIQDKRCQIFEPWRGMFRALGRTPEFQTVQAANAEALMTRAGKMVVEYGLSSERALALMFDVLTQNGSISAAVKAQILADYKAAPQDAGPDREVARMKIVAQRRAAVAREAFRADVLARKMCIAEGQGVVHGLRLDLAEQFGLTLAPAPVSAVGARA